ncbi:LORF2 protein, partial [Crocuta crocuta]
YLYCSIITVAKLWKQPKCPLTDEWIKMWCIYIYITHAYITEYYSAIKRNEILPFAKTWMNLESIMLSEISQRKTNTIMI